MEPGAWKKGKVDRKKGKEIKEQMVGRLGGGLGVAELRTWHSLVELVKQGPR